MPQRGYDAGKFHLPHQTVELIEVFPMQKSFETMTPIPVTEGIKYAGSKLKLLPQILMLVEKVRPQTVFDAFSGTTRVSQALAQCGYAVRATDVSVWSEVFGQCYLINRREREYYEPIIKHLNNLPPCDGWFTEHYGGDENNGSAISPDGLKKPLQRHNTRKLDAIREEIDRLALPFEETCVLLTSLIHAVDSVDSTLGHYVSYLSRWSPRSYKTMRLECPQLIPQQEGRQHTVDRGDVFDLLPKIEADLAYFDPPYGSNNEKMPPSRVRYASYYHLWTTICRNDRPELFGKARRRVDTSDTMAGSIFEEFRCDENGRFIAVEAIRRMLTEVRAKHVILSYNSNGKATAAELHEAVSSVGKLLEVVEIDYKKNVMAEMRWTHEWVKEAEQNNREFLFLLEKY